MARTPSNHAEDKDELLEQASQHEDGKPTEIGTVR